MANNHTAGTVARTFAPSELCQRMLAKTSKGTCGPCILYLEDGTIFYGRACGAEGTATGEVCFNTSLEGYFEVMTDPSYAGQIVTMTYPQIGNYGIDETDVQSAFPGDDVRPTSAPAMRGMIVRDMCATPSNWRSAVSVPEYLRAHGIVAIEGVDTRALVRHLRDNGSKMGIISTEIFDVDELAERLAAAPTLVGENLVKTVSCPEPHEFAAADLPAEHDFALTPAASARHKVVAYDCGVKRGILEGLVRAGCDLTVVPWDTPASEVLDMNPDGVFLSNGPGDPDAVVETYEQVQQLIGKVPVFGICLGHQMISLACGAQMEKLKFGHRGGNQPVMNLVSRRVEITAQNHGFGLLFPSLGKLIPELSGGETQRLMLARALYKDGPIIALDEPTAALDPIAENDIYQKYSSMTQGRTSLFISHRLASTRFCDRIIMLKDGCISEEGTHDELMRRGGEYAKLFAVQSKYYREGGREYESENRE